MTKCLIVGGGPSVRWDVGLNWQGDILTVDAYTKATMRWTRQVPKYVFTLEDQPEMERFFQNLTVRPNIVVSTRTLPELRQYLKQNGFPVIEWDNPLLEVVWNVGMMAWWYAWSELGYTEIYLTGFDHLTNPEPSMLERWWRETFYEFKAFAPKDLKTYIVGPRNYNPPKEHYENQNYFEYRKKRDLEFVSRNMGNHPEPMNERLL